jgi:hypothetical protein
MLDLWQHPDLQLLDQAFTDAGYELRIVGGAVRDALLGVPSKDVDLCTNATPDEMCQLANAHGLMWIPTGLQHGTLTILVRGEPYEITTLRIDVETDGRHAEVEFTRSFELDAGRRDFTFNAMSVDRTGTLHDYFGGQAHLAANEIHFVGDAPQRVREDYLRVLRFFRFAARYGSVMSHHVLHLFSEPWVRTGLAQVSKERVWMEMSKLLVSKDRLSALWSMQACGVARAVGLERLKVGDLEPFNRTDTPVSALSLMVQDPTAFAQAWRLSRVEAGELEFLCRAREVTPPEVQRDCGTNSMMMVEDFLVNGTPRAYVVSLARMYLEPLAAQHADEWAVPQFPVTGAHLMAKGYTQGKEMGAELRRLRDVWRDSRFTATVEQLVA